jgi:septum formation protein
MRVLLASASPRRRDLLRGAGVAFEAAPVDVDEDLDAARPGAPPAEVAVGLALRKALARARLEGGGPALVLAADTIVVAPGGALFGKARDEAEAGRMLAALSGRAHDVVTGVAVLRADTGACSATSVASEVRFRTLGPEVLARYLASGLWRGKAGAYGVQDGPPGGRAGLVEEVRGSVTNVIGLPVEETLALLAEARRWA